MQQLQNGQEQNKLFFKYKNRVVHRECSNKSKLADKNQS